MQPSGCAWASETCDVLAGMAECNCPPIHDVLRHDVGTKPPCPVHPEPPGLADVLLPLINTEGMRSGTLPLPPGRARRS